MTRGVAPAWGEVTGASRDSSFRWNDIRGVAIYGCGGLRANRRVKTHPTWFIAPFQGYLYRVIFVDFVNALYLISIMGTSSWMMSKVAPAESY